MLTLVLQFALLDIFPLKIKTRWWHGSDIYSILCLCFWCLNYVLQNVLWKVDISSCKLTIFWCFLSIVFLCSPQINVFTQHLKQSTWQIRDPRNTSKKPNHHSWAEPETVLKFDLGLCHVSESGRTFSMLACIVHTSRHQ